MAWPMAELLAWEMVLDLVGPLDWRREDWRDARRHAFEYGRIGETIDDARLFRPARKGKTEDEEYLEHLESLLPVAAALGEPGSVQALNEKIKLQRQKMLRRPKRK